MAQRRTFGIIGQGSFGKFVAQKLSTYFSVITYAKNDPLVKLQAVCNCDFVVLAVPLSAYDQLLESIKPLLSREAVIVDVCSVKEQPISKLQYWLPHHKILATHPLFGPESAANSLSGHTVILCRTSQTPAELLLDAKRFFERLGLVVKDLTAAKHDELMADVQGLTFFIAEALVEYGVRDHEIITPSFQRLLDLAELEKHHSADLLATIESGNRFVGRCRQWFIELLSTIDQRLAK